ncbi:MAG: hypothetical protein WAQ25_02885 [Candidatus Saccharimonas sp.]
MKRISEAIKLPQTPEAAGRRRNRILKPLATLSLVTVGIGIFNVVHSAKDATDPKEIGCVTAEVGPGYALGAVNDGIIKLQSLHPKFNPVSGREIVQQAERVGVVQSGQQLNVCGVTDPIMGDSVVVTK